MSPSLTIKAKHFLSGRIVTLVIVLLVMALRIIQLVYFYNLHVDGLFQAIAAQNLAGGHGVSITKVLPGDLSTIIYEPLVNWPPGYSVLLSPFYILFDHNYIAAGLALDILCAIILILVSRRILKILDTPIYLVNIYSLLTGFFIYFFYFMTSSDAATITFFMIALYSTLLMIKKDQYTTKTLVVMNVSLFVCAFIKYLYMPIAFIIPIFLFLRGFADHNTPMKKAGLRSAAVLAFGLIVLLVYQKSISGSATYISQPIRGFYPENLLVAYPFLPASFIKPESIGLLLQKQHVTGAVFRLWQCIHLLLFLAAIIYISRRLVRYGLKNITVTGSFFYLAFFISAGIVLLLAVLSVRVAPEENMPGLKWTYVAEARYYGVINVLLHLAVFVLYRYYRQMLPGKWKYVFYFSLLLMLPEMFRGAIFTGRRIMNFKTEEYSWQNEYRFQKYADGILEKERNKYNVENAVVTGSFYYMYYRVSLYSRIPPMINAASINEPRSLNAKKPTLLLIILHERDLPEYQSFISNHAKEVAGQFNGYYFYTVYVYPH